MGDIKTPQASLPPVLIPTGTVTIPFKYTGAGTQNQVLDLVSLPAGAVVTEVYFQVGVGATSLTGTLKVTQAGATAAAITLINAQSLVAANKDKKYAPEGLLPVYTEYTDGAGSVKLPVLSLTIGGANLPASEVIKGAVTYTLQNAERFQKASDQ